MLRARLSFVGREDCAPVNPEVCGRNLMAEKRK
jgi:hypothetical protein